MIAIWLSASAVAALGLSLVRPLVKLRRAQRVRVPVTDSNRRMRDKRANVVLNADAGTIAFALGPYEAQLAGLQVLADEVADLADDEPRHSR